MLELGAIKDGRTMLSFLKKGLATGVAAAAILLSSPMAGLCFQDKDKPREREKKEEKQPRSVIRAPRDDSRSEKSKPPNSDREKPKSSDPKKPKP